MSELVGTAVQERAAQKSQGWLEQLLHCGAALLMVEEGKGRRIAKWVKMLRGVSQHQAALQASEM